MLSNNLWSFAGLAVIWATGILVVRQLLGRSWVQAASCGWLLGSGLTSLAVLFIYVAGGTLLPWLPITLVTMALSAFLWPLRYPGRPRSAVALGQDERPGPGAWVVLGALFLLCVSALVHGLITPEVQFDALHNWSFKALSTACHGRPFQGYWPFILFPNHIPFLAAAFMALQHAPQETAVHVIPFLFFLACIGIMVQAARDLSGHWEWGYPMALFLVLGSPLMVEHTNRVYCDLPLAALHLASVAMAILFLTRGHRSAAFLSGIFSGLGMWTKTEGVMLALGVAGGFFLAALLLPRDQHRATINVLIAWCCGLFLTGGPWLLFLLWNHIAADSSGHLDQVVHWARFPVIFHQTVAYFRYRAWIAAVGALFFFTVGWSRSTRPLYVFLAVTIGAGLLHVWLPLLMIPDDAFGGWRAFLQHGRNRYGMHIAPVLLLSAALVARTGRCAGLNTLLYRLMVRPKRRA